MNKRERLAKRPFPAIATLVSPVITTKRRAFLDMGLPPGVEVQNEKD